MRAWDYRVETIQVSPKLEDFLNRLGEDGWELTGTLDAETDRPVGVFKRLKLADSPLSIR